MRNRGIKVTQELRIISTINDYFSFIFLLSSVRTKIICLILDKSLPKSGSETVEC